MYTKQPEKLLIINILDILRTEYDMTADRKAIRRNLQNLMAMRYWALQYAPYVTILSPQSLADDVKKDLKDALQRYEER